MRTRHIEIFHAIYAAGSISQAASVLNVSQPALSKALRLAEQELGFPLFERTASGLVPTREADELYAAASRVKAELATFQAVIALIRDSESRIASFKYACLRTIFVRQSGAGRALVRGQCDSEPPRAIQ